MNKNIIINLLWTGGLDSTFRLVELSRENVEIQPYYIIDPERKSTYKEKEAMEKIYSLLKKNKQTKASLKELKYIQMKNIHSDKKITESWQFFSNYNKLGNQYDFLARFAKQNDIILEVGLENSPRGKASTVLNKFGYLQEEIYPQSKGLWGKVFRIPENCIIQQSKDIFGRLRFPQHLFTIEKIEEIELLKHWGYEDIIHKTWFCHDPVLGYPCGRCNPCKDALNEGLSWRIPRIGRIMGTARSYLRGLIRRIK